MFDIHGLAPPPIFRIELKVISEPEPALVLRPLEGTVRFRSGELYLDKTNK